jgi:ketosteroid isomerase-like protein
MSQENVETISRAIDAWNRRDLDGFLAGAHPDLEWHPALPAGVEGSGSVYRGHDGA